MSTSQVEYDLVEDVESIYGYTEGGYKPILIADRLRERYRIVHKLGYGSFSTVWLAFDETTSKYVAIKVGIADSDRGEVDILSQLNASTASAASSFGKELIPSVVDRFDLESPNGMHPCLVTVPARCSLRDAVEASDSHLFQLDVARSLAAQLAFAVSFIHAAGYAHGDLHMGNLLLQIPGSLANLSVDQLYTKFGSPETEPVVRVDGKPLGSGVPSYVAIPVWLGTPSDKISLSEAKLLLSDFGVAFRPEDQSRFKSYTPLVMRPPEALFEPTTPLSLASDIWSLGCIIFELLAHRSLIDGYFLPTQDDITAQQVELQGRPPSAWWDKWEERAKWFDEDGRALSKDSDVWPWDRRFEEWLRSPRRHCKMDVIEDDEKSALLELLQRMLSWKPEDRPTAQEVLGAAWIKRWALPAYQRAGHHVGNTGA